ncbi:MAG: hypothetical protein QNJ44_06270 [Rhodobacter sp.]|nr:hypothetical protein [Rhodobacter sp.]
MKLTEAADLIQMAYDGKLGGRVRSEIDMRGAQASMLTDGTLVVPGTNEAKDWARFNFDVASGDSRRKWHAGFLRHAQTIYPFAKGAGAKRVLGHSLGAASAQIVAASLQIPAICFASPRPLRGRTRFRGEHRILNICRFDDAVCYLPMALLGFRQIGRVHWISPGEPQSEGSHKLKDYLRAMGQGSARPELPESWA